MMTPAQGQTGGRGSGIGKSSYGSVMNWANFVPNLPILEQAKRMPVCVEKMR
ncbi:MAG: hypothetical protein USCAAHI_00826 [Beijerinckiaceae bacterium]|nr:MAG: hypothetical protein USCAAHI_00826 [Beijerinckiaceae bacterium]